MFRLAERWAKRRRSLSGGQETHLHLIFDALDHAGASQAHPHLHMAMGRGTHLGQFAVLHGAAREYSQKEEGRHYLSDLVRGHMSLGLGVEVGGGVAVVAPLDARKDHELMVVGANDDSTTIVTDRWIEAFHAVLRYA